MAGSNSIEFKLTVSGAPESVAAVERVRTALSGVALSLDRNLGAMIASNDADKQGVQTMSAYEAGVQGMIKAEALAATYADDSYSKHLLLAKAVEQARDAVQGATAPTTLWAKGISDAAAAAAAGAQPYSNLATAFGRTGSASRQAGDNLKSTHQELFEGARLTRRFIDTVGEAAPGLSAFTGLLTGLSRETHGFTVAQIGMTAGALVAIAVFGKMVAAAQELIKTQAAVNKAVTGMDFSAAEAGFSQVIDKVREVDEAWKHVGADSNFITRLGSDLLLIGDFFSNSKKQAEQWSGGIAATWASLGRGQATLAAVRVELLENAKAFENLAKQAPTIDALRQALENQVVAEHDAALAAVNTARANDDKFRSAREGEIEALQNLGKQAEAQARIEILAEQMALRARERNAEAKTADDALVAARIANLARLAAAEAQQFTDAAKLIDVNGRIATEAIRSAQLEVDARHAVARADADFFGTSLQGLSQYQASRRASITEEANQELATLKASYAQQQEAQNKLIGGLEKDSLPQQAAYRQLGIMAQEYEEKRQALSDQTAQKLRDNALQETNERRANYARDIELVASSYAQAQALGQEDIAVKLGFLQRAAQDENLSLQQRRQYQQQFYSEAREAEAAIAQYKETIGQQTVTQELARLRSLADTAGPNSRERIAAEQAYATKYLSIEQSLFASLKASGQLSTTEEVARLQELASKYQANSQARIAAEQQWASAALSLRQQVASAGQGLVARAVSELQAEGKAYISLGDIQRKIAEDQQKAMQTLSSGGSPKAIQDALSLAGAFTELTKAGVSSGEAISKGIDAARNALNGTRESVSGLSTSMDSMGSMAEADFSKIGAAVDGATEKTRAWGQAAEAEASKVTSAQMNAAKGWDATTHAIQVTRDEEGNIIGITNELDTSFDKVKDAALGIVPAITGVGDSAKTMGDAFQQGTQAATSNLAQIKDIALGIGPAVVSIGDSARTLGDGFQQGTQIAVTSLAQVKDAALGIGPAVTSVGDSARTLGDGFQQGSQAAVTALAQIRTTAEQTTHAFDGFRTTIPAAMTDAFSQAQPLFATFLSNLENMAGQGFSNIGRSIVDSFMRALMQQLDAASRAS